jgi:hypothetical protein
MAIWGDPPAGTIQSAPTKSGFNHNFFEKIVPMTYKWSRKTPPAILYNLREKSSPKFEN